MTREEARQIMSTWLVSSKGTKGQRGYIEGWFDEEDAEAFRMAIEALTVAVSREDTVTLNSPISIQADMVSVVRCKDCKYFELDHFDRIDDMPIITAHEICTKWNGGCKTSKDGFCFMGERREE